MFYAAFCHASMDNIHIICAPDREKARTLMRHYLKMLSVSSKTIAELTGKSFDVRLDGYDEAVIIAATKHATTSATIGVETGATEEEVVQCIKEAVNNVLARL